MNKRVQKIKTSCNFISYDVNMPLYERKRILNKVIILVTDEKNEEGLQNIVQ